jgi:hypothetical protein
MQIYYVYKHAAEQYAFISQQVQDEHHLAFMWVDCIREDVVMQTEEWQNRQYLSAECEGRIGNDTRNGIPA